MIPTATPELLTGTDLREVLAKVAGTLATASGLIHFAVINDHLDSAVIAGGFAVMGIAQWLFALRILTRPSHHVLLLGGALHAAIAATWAVTRTTGLAFIPGAEDAAAVGVADVVANTFALGAVGVALVWSALAGATRAVVLPPVVARRITAVVMAGALLLSVPALFVPHAGAHGPGAHSPATGTGHEGHQPGQPSTSTTSSRTATGGDGHTHGPGTAHDEPAPGAVP